MAGRTMIGRRTHEAPCTVEVCNTFEELSAHVRFDDGTLIHPGDEVVVHGAPVMVPYGESAAIPRRATVRRAGAIERLWTRMTGDIEFMELCEFSFSDDKLVPVRSATTMQTVRSATTMEAVR